VNFKKNFIKGAAVIAAGEGYLIAGCAPKSGRPGITRMAAATTSTKP
jgi:hypothetical protein